ncbi:MAG: tetratricopeptide repeat protein [Polyangiaceae bacterium]
MKEPERFIDGDPEDLAAQLLASAKLDAPEPEVLRATAAALGVVGTVAGAGGAAATGALSSSTQVGAVAKSGATLLAPKIGASIMIKWAGVGAVVGLVTAGGTIVATSPTPKPASSQAWAAGSPSGDVSRLAATPRTTSSALALALAEPPSAGVRTSTAPPSAPRRMVREEPPSETVTQPGETALSREVKTLDRAKRALAAEDPQRALRTLDEYAKSSATGVLDPEAQVLRIQALRKQGRVAEARVLASEFLIKHPDSSHAARLREFLASGK